MPSSVKEQLDSIRIRSHCASTSEAVRRALGTLDFLMTLQESGVKFIARKPTGEEEIIRIV